MSEPAALSAKPLSAFTKLLVVDLDASHAFYIGLGFTQVGRDSTFVHLRWFNSGDLFLVPLPKTVNVDGKRGWGVLLGFVAQSIGVDSVAAKATALNRPVQGPDLQPWQTREVVVTDPDGYRLNFIEVATAESVARTLSS